MQNLYFSSQFADAVESGRVRQTVRPSAPHIGTGTELRLRAGSWGSAQSRWIADVVCTGTEAVEIAEATLLVGGRYLDTAERETFAKASGFDDYAAMVAYHYVTPESPFDGRVIRWEMGESDAAE